MAFAGATLALGSTTMRDSITHFQLHNGPRGAEGTTNAIGARVAVSGAPGTVNGTTGAITWPGPYLVQSLTANQGLAGGATNFEVSYWSAGTGGTYRGGATLTGDTSANAAGDYTITSVTENVTSS